MLSMNNALDRGIYAVSISALPNGSKQQKTLGLSGVEVA